MNENIELQRFNQKHSQDSNSEEYHEISQEILDEPLFKSQPVTLHEEYDFFTKYDVKITSNVAKKEKHKKKEKAKDLMDVIHSEMAAKPLIIVNKITTADYNNEIHNYLESYPRIQQMMHRGHRNTDTEYGYKEQRAADISPIFPRILEGNTSKNTNINVEYMEPSLFSDILSEYVECDTQQRPKFLDVILKNIKFKHHHEFSLEKLLTVKLLEVYEEYIATKKTLLELSRHVELNRRTRNNLREQLFKINQNKDDVRFDDNVLKYTKLMLEYKEKYLIMLKLEKGIIHKLISLWADIDMIREKSGYVRTNYILEIERTKIDDDEFQKQWSQTFESEYSDLLIKIEFDYISKYLEYKELKKNKNKETGEGHNILSKPKLKIDYDDIKTEAEKIVNDILPKSKIEVDLKNNKVILSPNQHNSRDTSLTHNYCFKVYVNEVFVGASDTYVTKTGQWDIDFDECLSIEILPHNSSLNIILTDNDEDVSFLRLNIPGIKKLSNESSFVSQIFTYNKIVEPTANQIGSSYDIKEICTKNRVRLKSSNLFKGKLLTMCEVNIQLGWNDKFNDIQHESVQSCIKIGCQIKHLLHSKDEPNIIAIKEIVNYLYECDVESNPNVTNKLNNICESTFKMSEIFKTFGKNEDLTRYKLLHLRNNGGFADLQNKTVPLYSNQISTEQFNTLQKSQKGTDHLNIKGHEKKNIVDLQRFIGEKFVEKLNTNLMKNVNEFLLKKTYKDVVRDFGDLSLRAIISNRADINFTAGPSATEQRVIKESLSEEQEIQITVLKAVNLSDRSTTILSEEENEVDNIAGFKVHALRPFVRISYHGVFAQTPTAIGCHPTWNHTMKIKTRLEPLSSILINIYDECKDNANELYVDDESTQGTVYYRKCNKWLGTLKVPLHTVLNYGSIRGTFKIVTPILTIGYENISPKENQSYIPEVSQLMKKEMTLMVLHISTSISHLGGFHNYYLPVPNDLQDDFIIKHLNEFVTEYINDFPTRNISLTFIDSTGKNKCVCEFIQPIPLPDYNWFPINPKKAESALSKSSGHSKSSSSRSSRKKSSVTGDESLSSGLDGFKSSDCGLVKNMEAAIRYVALIPTYEVTESYVVTLVGAELLKVLYGAPLDHSILLASYFVHLKIKCWIIVGFGLPRGLSSYVLIKYYNNKLIMDDTKDQVRSKRFLKSSDGFGWYIYDAVSGERFELREIGCPLKAVSYVFDCENIWVNVQTSQECESISFDFNRSTDWQVVFDKPLFVPRSFASESLYSKPVETESMRSDLENKIKNKVQKWRSHVKTIWNRYCSSLLKEMLPYYEYWAFNPMESRPNLGNRLKQLMATYKIFGFPLNMSYLNTKQIISNIKSTAIHVNEDPNVEFGLSVEIFAYPNNVLSVWVFLASITRI